MELILARLILLPPSPAYIPKGVQLARVLFPVGHMLKSEVKSYAAGCREFDGLRVLRKPESSGICFVGERNFSKFLCGYVTPTPGR